MVVGHVAIICQGPSPIKPSATGYVDRCLCKWTEVYHRFARLCYMVGPPQVLLIARPTWPLLLHIAIRICLASLSKCQVRIWLCDEVQLALLGTLMKYVVVYYLGQSA